MDIHLKKGKWILAFCILSSAVFLSLFIWRPDTIEERVETLTLDYRFHIRNLIAKPAQSGEVVIIAIDEKSLKEFGRWPWSRKVMTTLIKEIMDSNPKVLAVDIFFSEPESKEADRSMGDIFASKKENIILALPFEVWVGKKSEDIKNIPDEIIDSAFLKVQELKSLYPVEADRILPTIPEILRNNLCGHVYSHPDLDGKLRWEILYLKYGDEFFPSLALLSTRMSLGLKPDEMIMVGNRGVSLGTGIFIPSDSRGRMLINYLGKEGTFKPISATDVFRKKVRKEELENKTVFLGTTAIATYDLKNTPFSANMPGVEKNATVVENILRGDFLKKSTGYIEIIVIIMTGFMTGIFLPRLNALRGALLSFVFFSGYIVAVQLLFIYANLWVNLIYPAANMMTIAVVVTVAKYFFEEKKSRQIRAMFSSYVSPKIVEELINNPEKAKLGGDRKVVTILFSDIIGFTTLSERRPPEEVVDLLNEYFKEMTDIIFKWDGTLDKFVGDEIMAFWGAPADQPNHAELAFRCALHMVESLARMQEKWKEEGKDILDCGIGLNTGEVIIGNIGAAGKKMDYTVIGDHVNLAARVEKLTRNYHAKILLTEFTKNELDTLIKKGLIGHCNLMERDTVKVKGKEKEVKIFELKGTKHGETHPE
jgi:adenylate cyclase